jgi:hypothetical protein
MINLTWWTVGTFTIWLKGHLMLNEHEVRSLAGEFKAAAQLASALQHELQIDPLKLTEKKIRQQVKNRLDGGAITYEPQFQGRGIKLAQVTFHWVRKGKWWFITSIASSTISISMWITYAFGRGWKPSRAVLVVASTISLPLITALFIGSTHKGRAITYLVSLVVSLCFLKLSLGR